MLLAGCNAGPSSNNPAYEKLDNKDKLRFNQDFIQGQNLYTKHCSNCHQLNGEGLGRLIPPLAEADFLIEQQEAAICGIKHGMQGEIIVNGVAYNQPMPANKALTDLEIAQIMTYVGNSWGNELGLFRAEEIRAVLNACD